MIPINLTLPEVIFYSLRDSYIFMAVYRLSYISRYVCVFVILYLLGLYISSADLKELDLTGNLLSDWNVCAPFPLHYAPIN